MQHFVRDSRHMTVIPNAYDGGPQWSHVPAAPPRIMMTFPMRLDMGGEGAMLLFPSNEQMIIVVGEKYPGDYRRGRGLQHRVQGGQGDAYRQCGSGAAAGKSRSGSRPSWAVAKITDVMQEAKNSFEGLDTLTLLETKQGKGWL